MCGEKPSSSEVTEANSPTPSAYRGTQSCSQHSSPSSPSSHLRRSRGSSLVCSPHTGTNCTSISELEKQASQS
ncbi:hypothetical protein LEMLEM_LOCUS19900 [Lemmus lemmus]